MVKWQNRQGSARCLLWDTASKAKNTAISKVLQLICTHITKNETRIQAIEEFSLLKRLR